MSDDVFLTPDQLAKRHDKCIQNIYERHHRGTLGIVGAKFGGVLRFRLADVMAYEARQFEAATAALAAKAAQQQARADAQREAKRRARQRIKAAASTRKQLAPTSTKSSTPKQTATE